MAPYTKNERDEQTSFSSNPKDSPVHDALSDLTPDTTPLDLLGRGSGCFGIATLRFDISTRPASLVAEALLSAVSPQNFAD